MVDSHETLQGASQETHHHRHSAWPVLLAMRPSQHALVASAGEIYPPPKEARLTCVDQHHVGTLVTTTAMTGTPLQDAVGLMAGWTLAWPQEVWAGHAREAGVAASVVVLVLLLLMMMKLMRSQACLHCESGCAFALAGVVVAADDGLSVGHPSNFGQKWLSLELVVVGLSVLP